MELVELHSFLVVLTLVDVVLSSFRLKGCVLAMTVEEKGKAYL